MPRTPFEWVLAVALTWQVGRALWNFGREKVQDWLKPPIIPAAKPRPGSMWVEGNNFHFIGERGDFNRIQGSQYKPF